MFFKKIAALIFSIMIFGSAHGAWDNGKSEGFNENGELLLFMFDENQANKISGVQDLGIRYNTMRTEINNSSYTVSFALNDSVFSNFDNIVNKSTVRWGVMGYAQGFLDSDYGMLVTTNKENPHTVEQPAGLIDGALDVHSAYLAKVNSNEDLGGFYGFSENNAIFGTEANNRYIGDPGTIGRSIKQTQPYDATAGVTEKLNFYNLYDDFSATGFSAKFAGEWILDLAGRTLTYSGLNVIVNPDADGDGVADSLDNCRDVSNADQLNTDGDAFGNACDNNEDPDTDGVADSLDNCRDVSNADQLNTDGDAFGNACDDNDDNDANTDEQEQNCGSDSLDSLSICPVVVIVVDSDLDGVPDSSDNCPSAANTNQLNSDDDSQGNACDANDDNDAFSDNEELVCGSNPIDALSVCPIEEELDTDGDGIFDDADNCPANSNADQKDYDTDGKGNVCDSTPYRKLTLTSTSSKDGWILESSETSSKGGKADASSSLLRVGDSSSDQQYRSILDFDTSVLPNNAVIVKATLTLKKYSTVGSVSSLGSLAVDMRTAYFGSSSSLSIADFETTASKSTAATLSGSTYYSSVLSTTAKSYISKTYDTQFRLRLSTGDNDDRGSDYLNFYSGNSSSSSKPSLVIDYYVP